MKTKHYLLLVLVGLTAFLTGLFIGKGQTEKPPGTVTETIETSVDTTVVFSPTPQTEKLMGTQRYSLPTYYFLGGYGGKPRQRGDGAAAETGAKAPEQGQKAEGLEQKEGVFTSRDSAIVELPVMQRHYADSTYEAWVSGPVDPRLDSLRVFAPTTVITKREWKPPKLWHLGVTAGYGYTPHGFQPYIGIGISYSLISWK